MCRESLAHRRTRWGPSGQGGGWKLARPDGPPPDDPADDAGGTTDETTVAVIVPHPDTTAGGLDGATRAGTEWSSAFDHRYVKSSRDAGKSCPRRNLNSRSTPAS